jgi:kallikrein
VIMKEVELDLVEFDDCEAKFRETRLGNKFDLHKSFICAGGQKNQDTCKGENNFF